LGTLSQNKKGELFIETQCRMACSQECNSAFDVFQPFLRVAYKHTALETVTGGGTLQCSAYH